MTESMVDEIKSESNKFLSYEIIADSYIMVIRKKIDDYEKNLSFGKYPRRIEDGICKYIKYLKELERQNFSYRLDDLAKIENIFVKINEKHFEIDEPLSDDTLDGRLILK